MNVEFNGIISGFEIFALHIRIFRVKKVAPTDGPTQAVKETCTGDPRLPYLIESLRGLLSYLQGLVTNRSSCKDPTSVKLN